MNAPALGEAATQLSWLFPGASTFVALARAAPASTWDDVRLDPGGILLVLRQSSAIAFTSLQSLLHRIEVLDGAVRIIDLPEAGFVNWNQAEARTIYNSALATARTAYAVAIRTAHADPETAWCAALLVPLGWMAMCAVAPGAVAACWKNEEFAARPCEVQRRLWGMDHASIARRLCRRWGLPAWLTAVIGHLDLAVQHAEALGADRDLFRIVQLAVALVEGHLPLQLAVGAPADENARFLGLDEPAVAELTNAAEDHVKEAEATNRTWQPPQSVPLLRDLLLLAIEKRWLSEAPAVIGLESDIDNLHFALREQRRTEGGRLHALKLAALAEFAAGAGHEINNPLAVISGQAQYLLNHEPDPSRQKALQTIVAQTKRIHQILAGLMQFARPTKPKKLALNVTDVTREVVDSLNDLAAERSVTLCYTPPEQPLLIWADPKQVHTAIQSILRNAVEAAPPDGWASIRVEVSEAACIEWIVEDSGPGPSAIQQEHLFDPFYSGRHAGRGRGLGLPTAWQLARNHGGDLAFAGAPAGHTRFVLSLPLEPIPPDMRESTNSSTVSIPHETALNSMPLNGQSAA